MFIKSQIYSTLETSCGVELSFSKIQSIPEKIADISSASRANRISNLRLTNISQPLVTGQYINIRDVNISGTNIFPLDPSFLGTYQIDTISNSVDISYYQNNLDIINVNYIGELYSVSNIQPKDFYSVEFSIESKVPANAQAELRPSGYIIGGSQSIVPTTILQMSSEFSTSAKVLIKMVIRDTLTNTIFKNEYLEVVMTDSLNKPCEIISSEPIKNSYFTLDINNNWTYNHQVYSLAKFLPNIKDDTTSMQLIKKNEALLPSIRDESNKIKITTSPIKLTNKKVTIDQVRTSIINKFNSSSDSYIVGNIGNQPYDIIVGETFTQPSQLSDIVVALVPPATGVAVKFNEIATAEIYTSEVDSIPGISLLYWKNNNINEYIGELHFNKDIYNNDPIVVSYSGHELVGTIKDFTHGLNYLVID
jgi:hypothetical protein